MRRKRRPEEGDFADTIDYEKAGMPDPLDLASWIMSPGGLMCDATRAGLLLVLEGATYSEAARVCNRNARDLRKLAHKHGIDRIQRVRKAERRRVVSAVRRLEANAEAERKEEERQKRAEDKRLGIIRREAGPYPEGRTPEGKWKTRLLESYARRRKVMAEREAQAQAQK